MQNALNYHYKSQEELIELITQQQIQLTDQQKKLSEQQKQILFLEEYISAQNLRQFANKSEKSNAFQISLFNEAILPKNAEKLSQEDESITVASYQRSTNKVGRKPLPDDLPRMSRIYDLKEDEKICACGCQLTHITDEKSEQLEIIPAKIYVIEHIRKKYACKQCEETIKTATMPPLPIPRSIAASGLLSHVIIAKFQDHLPLYRQEKILKRLGIDLPRATLCLWVLKVAALLKPLMKLLHDYIINYDVAYADETTVQVLKETNKGIQSKKYMWLFAGGPPNQFAFYYQYHPSRSHTVLEDYFGDFKGYLHCDGYPGYDSLAKKNTHITLSGCLYHARRKFVEVTKITKSTDGVAHHVLKYITQLATIEEEIKSLPPAEKYIARNEKAKPILDAMQSYLLANQPTIPPKSLLGQAVSYSLNQWPKLLVYLQDGRLENNNNRSERAIKPFVMGRKGWLFADSVEGAHAAATIYSLIETCKHHQIEPYYWLKYVLERINLCQTLDDFEDLLPFNIDKSKLEMPIL